MTHEQIKGRAMPGPNLEKKMKLHDAIEMAAGLVAWTCGKTGGRECRRYASTEEATEDAFVDDKDSKSTHYLKTAFDVDEELHFDALNGEEFDY